MKKKIKAIFNNKGMSLIEALVSLVLTFVVIMGVLQVSLYTTKLYHSQRIQSEQFLILENVEELITSKIRYAQNVYIGSSLDVSIIGFSGDMLHCNNVGTLYFKRAMDTNLSAVSGIESGQFYNVEVVFDKHSDDVLKAHIKVSDENSNSTENTIYCNILNFEITGKVLNDPTENTTVWFD